MSRGGEWLLRTLNGAFAPPNTYFATLAQSQADAFAYSMRAGAVVHDQFAGCNDLAGKVVLDFGCGRGGKTIYYASRGPRHTIGLDQPTDWAPALDYARRHGWPVEFIPARPDDLIDLPDDTCDVVLTSSVLEHLERPARTFAELRRVLKPGGRLLNRWHPFHTRYGAHVHSAIGLPFAHRLFGEATVVRTYRRLLKGFTKLPPTMRPGFAQAETYGELELPLNRLTLRQMRDALHAAGFELAETRYLRGTRRIRPPRRLPLTWLALLIDYEVQICINRKPARNTTPAHLRAG